VQLQEKGCADVFGCKILTSMILQSDSCAVMASLTFPRKYIEQTGVLQINGLKIETGSE
jgi:hypothetical protein